MKKTIKKVLTESKRCAILISVTITIINTRIQPVNVQSVKVLDILVSRRACEILGVPYEDQKIITAHVGNGGSITAIKNGKSVDTSMGLTFSGVRK